MKRVTHYAVVALIMLAVVSPALAQDTGAVTSAYERAFAAIVAVVVAVLGVLGYALIKQDGRWLGVLNVLVTIVEAGAKLTETKEDDAEAAKLRAEVDRLQAELDKLKNTPEAEG